MTIMITLVTTWIIIASILHWKTDEGFVWPATFMTILFMTFMVQILSMPIARTTATVVKHQPIVSLNTTMNTHGSFVLGTGVIRSEEVYTAFQQRRDGAYTKVYFEADETLIYQDTARENSHAKLIYKKVTRGWPFERTDMILDKIKLHVPKGTVVKQFNAK